MKILHRAYHNLLSPQGLKTRARSTIELQIFLRRRLEAKKIVMFLAVNFRKFLKNRNVCAPGTVLPFRPVKYCLIFYYTKSTNLADFVLPYFYCPKKNIFDRGNCVIFHFFAVFFFCQKK